MKNGTATRAKRSPLGQDSRCTLLRGGAADGTLNHTSGSFKNTPCPSGFCFVRSMVSDLVSPRKSCEVDYWVTLKIHDSDRVSTCKWSFGNNKIPAGLSEITRRRCTFSRRWSGASSVCIFICLKIIEGTQLDTTCTFPGKRYTRKEA